LEARENKDGIQKVNGKANMMNLWGWNPKKEREVTSNPSHPKSPILSGKPK